jgi:hypothetical protein
MDDYENRRRGDGACGKRPVPVLVFRHRACHRNAAGAVRDGDQAEPMHSFRTMRLRDS